MLNRHLLRIKAMQTIYAYRQARVANYHLALEQIAQHYANILMIIGKQSFSRLHQEEIEAKTFFEQFYKQPSYNAPLQLSMNLTPQEVGSAVVLAYHQKNQKDLQTFRTRMLKDTEMIFERYIRLLKLILMLADFVAQEHQERTERLQRDVKIPEELIRLMQNPLLETLRNLQEFEIEWSKKKFIWDINSIRTWYKILIKEEEFRKLLRDAQTPPYEIVRYIINQFIFKNEAIETYLEEQDINWSENRHILKSMLLKTFKEKVENPDREMRLYTLSKNWEDDGAFFLQLFDAVLANEEEFEKRIAEKSKKWAYERIAEIDKILMHMALSEIITFPSIPVKVTINEYIDISKEYSTPKSWQFINGILDVIVDELEKEGRIRKSGRGLIDNKS
ncbi:MAG: transcription antitermination factor NusB [Cytophagales bacterium]|nr:transcription antitermination factor NusB [Cytophagales bacterium]MDW8385312.1 transcription antitermination factor NusB [Flammeovirgaceae bacterium]